MKTVLLFLLLPFAGFSQDGFGSFHSSTLLTEGKPNTSIGFAGGYRIGHACIGATTDFYLTSKFNITSLDIRVYGNTSPRSFYLSVQQGYTLYGKTVSGVEVSGGMAGGISAGYEHRFKNGGFGFVVSAGWQYYTFKIDKLATFTNGLRLSAGLIL